MPQSTDIQNDLEASAVDAVRFADRVGVGVYARQASDFAPAHDREQDTVVVVLRGEAARRGRKALTELADLIRDSR